MRDENELIVQIPAIGDLEKAQADIKAAEALREEARKRMHQSVISLAGQVGHDTDLRGHAIQYLYWRTLDIPVKWLTEAFALKDKEVRQIAGKAMPALSCLKCQKNLNVTAERKRGEIRRGLTRHQRNSSCGIVCLLICDSCRKEEDRLYQMKLEAVEQESKAKCVAREARLRELQTMPYEEYLRTQEWEFRRRDQLLLAGYRCQVCNATGLKLHVHHKTYERLGEEHIDDLIVLCDDCHRIHHQRVGRL